MKKLSVISCQLSVIVLLFFAVTGFGQSGSMVTKNIDSPTSTSAKTGTTEFRSNSTGPYYLLSGSSTVHYFAPLDSPSFTAPALGTPSSGDLTNCTFPANLTSLNGLSYSAASFIKMTAANTFALRTVSDIKTDLSLNNVANILDKLDATAAPTANDDSGDGYSVSSKWMDVTNDKAYICLDATETAAIWTEITQSGSAKLIAEDSGYGLDNGSTGRGAVGIKSVSLEYSDTGSTYGATGNYAHAEGYKTTASATGAHAEGQATVASGSEAHAEGAITTASGEFSHSEGANTTASGNGAHAEGQYTTASGLCAHSEGYYTTAAGGYSHAEGNYASTASGATAAHAGGTESVSNYINEFTFSSGKFSSNGDCQRGSIQSRISTSSTDQTELFLDNSSIRFILADNDAYTCKITVMGAQADGSVGDAVFQVKIHRQGSTTALSQSVRTILAWDADTNLGSPTITIEADDTNEALAIKVTPANATATRWTAVVEYVKINY